ncbi:MAG: hypothetical protein JZU67_00380 [Burkholderiaceae bacterium]|nr:hypothetical protein [Burkholderiaceae bacterium]
MQVYTDVPLPAKRSGRPRSKFADALSKLSQGHSMFFDLGDKTVDQIVSYARTTLSRTLKNDAGFKGCKYAVRPALHPDTGLPSVGVWRID